MTQRTTFRHEFLHLRNDPIPFAGQKEDSRQEVAVSVEVETGSVLCVGKLALEGAEPSESSEFGGGRLALLPREKKAWFPLGLAFWRVPHFFCLCFEGRSRGNLKSMLEVP